MKTTQMELTKIQNDNERKSLDLNSRDQLHLTEFIDRLNTNLQHKWQSAVHHQQHMQEKERRFNEYFRQIENETDDEIEHLKEIYAKQLADTNEYTQELTTKVREKKKRTNMSIIVFQG